METLDFSIAKQYSLTPAGRHLSDGPFSGQRLREEILLPALRSGKKVSVDLDGAIGFSSSFLEEAFGGLVRAGIREDDLRDKLIIKAALKAYSDRAWRYIREAQEQSAAC